MTEILALVGALGGLVGGVAGILSLKERLAKGRVPKKDDSAEKADKRREEIRRAANKS